MKWNFNGATQITLVRIALTPCIMIAIGNAQWLIALILSAIAAFTDFLDGYYARCYSQETDFGKIIDPVADKVFIMGVLYALYSAFDQPMVPGWFVVLVTIKEFLLMSGALVLLYRNIKVMSPSWLSKVVTALLMFFIVYLIGVHTGYLYGLFSPMVTMQIFTLLAAGIVCISFDYGYKVYKILQRS